MPSCEGCGVENWTFGIHAPCFYRTATNTTARRITPHPTSYRAHSKRAHGPIMSKGWAQAQPVSIARSPIAPHSHLPPSLVPSQSDWMSIPEIRTSKVHSLRISSFFVSTLPILFLFSFPTSSHPLFAITHSLSLRSLIYPITHYFTFTSSHHGSHCTRSRL